MNIEIVTDMLDPVKPLIPLNIAGIKYLVLHHIEADSASWQDINQWHKENGWNCGGYNEYIKKDGTIIIMRGDNIGAQTLNMNSISYGIALEGNFNNHIIMPPDQYNSLMERINYNLKRFPSSVLTVPHRELVPTECPGKFFPLVKILSDINTNDLELAAALAILKTANVINTVNYWQINSKNGSIVKGEYARQLILNMANSLK